MTKISELVNFHTAYGSQVRLHDHFYDDGENGERLKGYMPISAHRAAFKQLVKSQLPDRNNKDKVFMLTGSYGTGKSHLCLMLANYFSRKSDSAPMQSLFANWAKRDPDGAQLVKNIRGDGRYLVAICEFGTGKPFEDMVLSSIEEALQVEGAEDVVLNTHFKGVLRQIEEWEKRRKEGAPAGAYDDFIRFLDEDDGESSLKKLKKDLEQNSSKAMERFQAAYQKTIGQRFNMHNDNIKSVLEDLLRSPDFKTRYRGLVILADEFGYALSEGKVPMSTFQSFAEMSKDGVDGLPIIFIGVGHRRFEMYANPALLTDFRVVRDRVTEVSLESEELEQIIAALVSPKKEEAIWKTEVQSNWLLTRMANEATKQSERKVKLFDYLREPDLLEQIVRNIYPMHPLSVYCLTKMSQDLGSDARSVFSFFRQNAGDGSYVWYVNNHDYKKS